MKHHSFSGKNIFSVIRFLAEFKRACLKSRIHDGAALWFFMDNTTKLALLAIIKRLKLSSNDVNAHCGTIILYAKVVNHLLRSYVTDVETVTADEEIHNFKQWSLTDGIFPEAVGYDASLLRYLQ